MLGPIRKFASLDFKDTNLGISKPVTVPVFAFDVKLYKYEKIKMNEYSKNFTNYPISFERKIVESLFYYKSAKIYILTTKY